MRLSARTGRLLGVRLPRGPCLTLSAKATWSSRAAASASPSIRRACRTSREQPLTWWTKGSPGACASTIRTRGRPAAAARASEHEKRRAVQRTHRLTFLNHRRRRHRRARRRVRNEIYRRRFPERYCDALECVFTSPDSSGFPRAIGRWLRRRRRECGCLRRPPSPARARSTTRRRCSALWRASSARAPRRSAGCRRSPSAASSAASCSSCHWRPPRQAAADPGAVLRQHRGAAHRRRRAGARIARRVELSHRRVLVYAQSVIPLVAELAPDKARGRAVGTILTALFLGILFGRLAGGLVATHLGWRWMYGLAALMSAALSPVLIARLPGTRPHTGLPYWQLLASMLSLMDTCRNF